MRKGRSYTCTWLLVVLGTVLGQHGISSPSIFSCLRWLAMPQMPPFCTNLSSWAKDEQCWMIGSVRSSLFTTCQPLRHSLTIANNFPSLWRAVISIVQPN
ncbi:hypothetical protein QBC45DRAFT_425547 [Copromyces sp. CBS 386.78]|nr:hypothetical protein QBC45DRAFT_425547 [Copromyces sp. CBS 386.78]